MLFSALALCLAPQHPADTDWYVEVPNVPALLESYAEAPIVRLCRDEGIRKSVGTIAQALQPHIASALEQAEQLGHSPDAILASVHSTLDHLRGLQSFSFSLAGWTEGMFELKSDLASWRLASARARELQAALDAHIGSHELPPAQLGDLEDLEPGDLLDPWGRPFLLTPDGLKVTCAHESLAALAALGPLAADASDADFPEAVREALLARFASDKLALTAALEFGASEAARAAADEWTELLARVATLEVSPTPNGGELRQLRWSAPPEGALPGALPGALAGAPMPWMLVEGTHVVFGVGSGESCAARLAGEAPALAPAGRFAPVLEAHAEDLEPGTLIVRSFRELSPLQMIAEAASVFSDEHADPDRPRKWLERFAVRTPSITVRRLVGSQFVTDRWTTPPSAGGSATPLAGLAALAAIEPVERGALGLVPEDAIGVFATTVDWRGLAALAREILAQEAPPGALDETFAAFAALEDQYGLDLEAQWLAALGNDVAVFLEPIALGLPEVHLLIELEDPQAFESSLAGLAELVRERSQGTFELAVRPYKKMPVWTLQRTSVPFAEAFAEGGPTGTARTALEQVFGSKFAPNPSCAFLDGTLLVSLTSISARGIVKRYLEPAEQRLFHPLVTASLPSDILSVGFMDWASMWMTFYTMGRGALSMAAMGGAELPFRASDLPDPAAIGRYFEPTVCWSLPNWQHTVSSFGPEVAPAVIGAANATALIAALARPSQVVREPEIDPGDPGDPGDSGQAALLLAAIESYRAEHGQAPSDLAQLGTLDPPEAALDAWQQPLRYEPTEDGFRLWSIGANGIDEHGQGDDVQFEP